MTFSRRMPRSIRRWARDTRGTSMVTSAVTLPLLIIVLLGFYWMMWFLTIKQTFHHGVLDAANYIQDQARYWNIDPTGQSKAGDPLGEMGVLPGDFYEWEARRVIANRLRDFMLPAPMISSSLHVTVTEPILAFAPDSTEAPLEVGQKWQEAGLCGSGRAYQKPGQFRAPENIRFLIRASYKVPLWSVNIPYMDPIEITLQERATGYVQCPRWAGQYELTDPDKSQWLAQQGPFMPFRMTVTPGFPTITATVPPTATSPPTPTEAPTATSTP